jgi:hypothetical protein
LAVVEEESILGKVKVTVLVFGKNVDAVVINTFGFVTIFGLEVVRNVIEDRLLYLGVVPNGKHIGGLDNCLAELEVSGTVRGRALVFSHYF